MRDEEDGAGAGAADSVGELDRQLCQRPRFLQRLHAWQRSLRGLKDEVR